MLEEGSVADFPPCLAVFTPSCPSPAVLPRCSAHSVLLSTLPFSHILSDHGETLFTGTVRPADLPALQMCLGDMFAQVQAGARFSPGNPFLSVKWVIWLCFSEGLIHLFSF